MLVACSIRVPTEFIALATGSAKRAKRGRLVSDASSGMHGRSDEALRLPAARPQSTLGLQREPLRRQCLQHEDDGSDTVYDVPPETTAWQRFTLRLMRPLVADREL